jgi:hypothetical protein
MEKRFKLTTSDFLCARSMRQMAAVEFTRYGPLLAVLFM